MNNLCLKSSLYVNLQGIRAVSAHVRVMGFGMGFGLQKEAPLIFNPILSRTDLLHAAGTALLISTKNVEINRVNKKCLCFELEQ